MLTRRIPREDAHEFGNRKFPGNGREGLEVGAARHLGCCRQWLRSLIRSGGLLNERATDSGRPKSGPWRVFCSIGLADPVGAVVNLFCGTELNGNRAR